MTRGRAPSRSRLTALIVPVAVASVRYGPLIIADDLGNTQVGGTSGPNLLNFYRFRAGQSSALNSIRFYIIANGNTGYSNGTGGTIRITVRTDDGTASHLPTSTVLATQDFAPGNPAASSFNTVTFGTPATLTAGTLYHLHWENVDASPTVNFLSLDGLHTYNTISPRRQPKYDNTDWAWGYYVVGTGPWVERPQYAPILQLNYANAVSEGVGYMEVSYTADRGIITGTSFMVRERFTVSGGNKSVSSMSALLYRMSGTGDLTIRLEDSTGAVLESGTVLGTSVPIPATLPPNGGASVVTVSFSIRTLSNGSEYRIRLSCPAATEYGIEPIRSGVTTYGFSASTVFSDGTAEKTTDGSAWVSGGRVANQNNLPVWFE